MQDNDPGRLLRFAKDHMDNGRFREALSLIHQFRKFPEEEWSDEDTFSYHLLSARGHVSRNEFMDAAKHCLIAMRFAEGTGDELVRAETMRWLGYIHWRKGDFHMARVYISEALLRAVRGRKRELEGVLRIEMGNVLNSLGDPDGAMGEFEKAIDLLETTDNTFELLRAYNNLGDLHYVKEEWERAAGIFIKAKETGADDPVNIAWASFNLGDCYTELGRTEDARREIDGSIPMLEEVGDEVGLMYALQAKGQMHGRAGEWDDALASLDRAREIARKRGMPVEEGKMVMSFGRVLKWKGDTAGAREHLFEARRIFEAHDALTFRGLVDKELKGL